jgi:hypothetical protein
MFGNDTGMPKCTGCARGHAINVRGYTGDAFGHCPACVAGKYIDIPRASICKDCEAGRFSNLTGGHGCTGCPKGTASDVVGLSTEHCPDCVQGKYSPDSGNPVCLSCAFWEYNDDAGSHQCKSCFSFSGSFLGFSHLDQCMTTWIIIAVIVFLICCIPATCRCLKCCCWARRAMSKGTPIRGKVCAVRNHIRRDMPK